jgi:spermidine synthase
MSRPRAASRSGGWVAACVAAAAVAVALALALAPAGRAGVLHTEKSLYRNIVVYEADGLRCMKFGRYEGGRQSCMSLEHPQHLVFEYTKMMMGALYLNPAPARVLVIGLGGGTLPSALQRILPAVRIDAVEIDAAVVRVAKTHFGWAPGAQTRVFEEDGRVFVKRAARRGEKYDLIMLDAFDHEYIPEHLLTREFLLEVRRLLAEGGVLAANTFSSSRLYHHESATYHSAFGDFYSLKKSNRVILLRVGGLPDKAALARNAEAVQAKLAPLGTGSQWLLPLFAVEGGWPAGTRILTDQYSPSNLLNAGS